LSVGVPVTLFGLIFGLIFEAERWIVWSTLVGAVVLLPAAIAARRGIKWGVAVIGPVTVASLVAVPLGTAFFYALYVWPERPPLEVATYALGIDALALWVGWRHARSAFLYLRAGDRDLLFWDYSRSISKPPASFRVWKNLKRALPSKRAKALAWVLVALPVGVIVLLGLTLALGATIGFVPKAAIDFVAEVVGGLVLYAAIVTVFFLYRYGARHVAPGVAAVQYEDHRAPILLLRSFKDENIQIQREFSPVLGIFYQFLPKRLDEFLEESLRSYGPVIAIGRPKEAVPPLGAAREYAGTDWELLVERRISESQFVVAILGRTEGLAWEMSTIMRLSARDKLILVVPPVLRARDVSERWESISRALKERFELPANAALISWYGDSVLAATARRFYRQVDGYRIALAWVLRARSEIVLRTQQRRPVADKSHESTSGVW